MEILNKKNIILLLVFLSLCILMNADVSADFLINKIDTSRGPSTFFSTDVEITNVKNEEITDKSILKVIFSRTTHKENRSIAIFKEPSEQKGRRLLLIGTDTWLYIPGSKKPIKISLSQKLSGGVSTGDILSVNLSNDYSCEIIGEEKVNNINSYKLKLTAKNTKVTYYKIIYYVSKSDYTPIKAEYITQSEKILKESYYKKYENRMGNNVCIEIIIKDLLVNNKYTIVKYLSHKSEKISDTYFNPDMFKDIEF